MFPRPHCFGDRGGAIHPFTPGSFALGYLLRSQVHPIVGCAILSCCARVACLKSFLKLAAAEVKSKNSPARFFWREHAAPVQSPHQNRHGTFLRLGKSLLGEGSSDLMHGLHGLRRKYWLLHIPSPPCTDSAMAKF